MENGNKPINPLPFEANEKITEGYGYVMDFTGLTKREYFAAMAMQSIFNVWSSAESIPTSHE